MLGWPPLASAFESGALLSDSRPHYFILCSVAFSFLYIPSFSLAFHFCCVLLARPSLFHRSLRRSASGFLLSSRPLSPVVPPMPCQGGSASAPCPCKLGLEHLIKSVDGGGLGLRGICRCSHAVGNTILPARQVRSSTRAKISTTRHSGWPCGSHPSLFLSLSMLSALCVFQDIAASVAHAAAVETSIAATVRQLAALTPVAYALSDEDIDAAHIVPAAVEAATSSSSSSSSSSSPPLASAQVEDRRPCVLVLLLPDDHNLFPPWWRPNADGHVVLLIRKSYVALAEEIVAAGAVRKTVVLGTSGVGLSHFGYYLLWHLVREFQTSLIDDFALGRPPTLAQRDIVWSHGRPPCFFHIRLSVGARPLEVSVVCRWFLTDGRAQNQLRSQLEDPQVWYLVDGMLPFSLFGLSSRMVVLSSPRRDVVHDLLKITKDKLRRAWLPVWSWAEVAALRSVHEAHKMKSKTLTVDQLRLSFDHWGGIPREVFKEFDDEQQDLWHTLVGYAGRTQPISALCSLRLLTLAEDARPQLMHPHVDEQFGRIGMRFATPFVRDAVLERVSERAVSQVRVMVSDGFSPEQMFVGECFASLVQQWIASARKGTTKLRCRRLGVWLPDGLSSVEQAPAREAEEADPRPRSHTSRFRSCIAPIDRIWLRGRRRQKFSFMRIPPNRVCGHPRRRRSRLSISS